MRLLRVTLVAAVSLTPLVSCSGGGGGAAPAPTPSPAPSPAPSPGPSPAPSPVACESFMSSNASVTTRIDNTGTMSAADRNNAIDGSLETSSKLVVNGSTSNTQGVAIRATAQSGIVFPSGRNAGAFYSVPSGSARTYTVSVRTLLAGELQESNNSDNSGGFVGMSSGHASAFNGIATTKPFDAVEVVVSNSQAEVSPTFEVFEICSDQR